MIPDSFRITFLTESDIKISPVHTISDSVFESVHTAPLRFTWRQKAYCLRKVLMATITTGAKILIENEAACCKSTIEVPERRRIGFMRSHELKSDPIRKMIRYVPLSRGVFPPGKSIRSVSDSSGAVWTEGLSGIKYNPI